MPLYSKVYSRCSVESRRVCMYVYAIYGSRDQGVCKLLYIGIIFDNFLEVLDLAHAEGRVGQSEGVIKDTSYQ